MVSKKDSNATRLHRHKRVRGKITGTADCPRLNVFRSLNHIYAQVIDDVKGVTLVAASSTEKDFGAAGGNKEGAKKVGEMIAKRAAEKVCQEILDPEFAKTRIAFRLVSQERNEELLKHIPWFPFHDLAMVFFICLDLDSADLVSALVHWPLLSAWDMDADTLRSLAEENTPILFPPVLTPLTELLLPPFYARWTK